MGADFVLSCESTVDMPFSYIDGRGIPVLFYSYYVDDVAYPDDMLRDPDALNRFYEVLNSGKIPTTSQLNEFTYESFFEDLLQKHNSDILHIAFGTGMTKSVENAYAASEMLKEKYPERRVIVIDSLCSSTGYGMLVDYAADMRDSGASIDEVTEWVLANRKRIHHQFYATQLDYYRRSGRMSGPTAMLATILNICPIMRIDNEGRIFAYGKVRGRANAIKTTLDFMEQHAEGGKSYSGKCFVNHSHSPEDAEKTRDAIKERFPNISGEIRICEIGTIIASHCGPGTVAVFFLGDERAPR